MWRDVYKSRDCLEGCPFKDIVMNWMWDGGAGVKDQKGSGAILYCVASWKMVLGESTGF